ncbi:hypothetical protein IB254_02505 [Pseudomonas sp. PDM03]|uniref:hypothetical protein n=1 Tax=Pseudomonas sp. PDM03 TaxID=2769266 RepID=UPI0017840F41|nr:hypothetical protein [Pseudomonas sp. PDM03]MBD9585918.1 hypothetical protein [Pseudomonas sp. PDM03]
MNNKEDVKKIIHPDWGKCELQDKNEIPVFKGDWGSLENRLYKHKHPRVPELRGEMTYQYHLQDGYVFFHMFKYMLTSRPTDRVWRRANIYLSAISETAMGAQSPDSMIMDYKWHDQGLVVAVKLNHSKVAEYSIGVQYDGSNNDVGEHEKWGPILYAEF